MIQTQLDVVFVCPQPQENPVTSALGSSKPEGEGSDGESLKVLRPDDTRVCFPVIPFIIPTLQTFRQLTGSEGVDFAELRFEEFCIQGSYQQRAQKFFESLGLDVKSSTATWLGISGFMRGAEAVDSINGFFEVSNMNDPGAQRVGGLICGITEFGGLFYTMIILTILVLALPCVTSANLLVGILYDIVVLVGAAGAEAADAAEGAAGGSDAAKDNAKKDSAKKDKQKEKKEKKEKAKKDKEDAKKKKADDKKKKAEEKKKTKAEKGGRFSRRTGGGTNKKALRRDIDKLRQDVAALQRNPAGLERVRAEFRRLLDTQRTSLRSSFTTQLTQLRTQLQTLLTSGDKAVRDFASVEVARLAATIAQLVAQQQSRRGRFGTRESAAPAGVFAALSTRLFGGGAYENVSPSDSDSESDSDDSDDDSDSDDESSDDEEPSAPPIRPTELHPIRGAPILPVVDWGAGSAV